MTDHHDCCSQSFFIAPYDPEHFILIAKSYELAPSGYWHYSALLSAFIPAAGCN